MRSKAVLSIGSNCGTRDRNISSAVAMLQSMMEDMRISGLYETPDVGGGSSRYMNAVAEGFTDLSIEDCTATLKKLEFSLGRDEETRKRGEVPLDIDIVIWDGKVIRPWDFRQQFFTIGYEQILSGSCPS